MSRLSLFFLLAAVPLVHAADDAMLRMENAWAREAPPVAKVMAAYGRLCNDRRDTVTITSIASSAFERVEMHETIETDTSARMHKLDTLAVAAGECANFAPGGKHFMLFAPAKRLRAGDEISLTLEFAGGTTQQIRMPVQRQGTDAEDQPADGHKEHHHHGH